MSERPIFFSPPMVRAILAGTKTQTRRVMPPLKHPSWTGYMLTQDKRAAIECGPDYPDDETDYVRNRYGVPGDRLWVKEGWSPTIAHSCCMNTCDCADVDVMYRADGEHRYFDDLSIPEKWTMPKAGPKTTARFMPHWASRITLEITDIRVQRLQEISEEDAIAEGVEKLGEFPNITPWRNYQMKQLAGAHNFSTPQRSFMSLWESINGKKYPWSSNPWLWCISFRRLA